MDFSGALNAANLGFLIDGLWITIQVATLSIVFSVVLGFILGVIRYYEIPVVSKVLGWVIDIIRNLPLLLIIFFSYFGLPQLGIQFNIFWSTVVALSIFESTMISEIVRGGLKALPSGQTEAGLATGMTRNETMRYILIPQVIRETTPNIVSQLIALIKDTSLATIITLPELTHNAKIIYSQNTDYVIPIFIALALLYFVVCFSLSLFSRYLNHHLNRRKVSAN